MSSFSKRFLIHLCAYTILFFLIPFLQTNAAPDTMNDLGLWILLLLMVNPAAVLILNGEAGVRIGFSIILCLLPPVLFTLSVYIFFQGNTSALSYSVMYGVIALASNGIAALSKRKKDKR